MTIMQHFIQTTFTFISDSTLPDFPSVIQVPCCVKRVTFDPPRGMIIVRIVHDNGLVRQRLMFSARWLMHG